jgi:uroporphyrinogen III methyltransferase/synthase
LRGKRVLVLRPAHQAQATAEAVRRRLAEPVVFPVIELCPPPDPGAVDRALRARSSYDWILFTSANGVESTFQALQRIELGVAALAGLRFAVIGPRTARALQRYGLHADLVADQFVAEELAATLLRSAAPRRVLLLRAQGAREALPQLLRAAGVQVDVVAVYQTRPVAADRARALEDLLVRRRLEVVLFTASSTVSSFVHLLGQRGPALLARVVVGSIGPITSKTARELGIRVDVTASQYTVEGLLDALEQHLARHQ